jgi:hypothetical protein
MDEVSKEVLPAMNNVDNSRPCYTQRGKIYIYIALVLHATFYRIVSGHQNK